MKAFITKIMAAGAMILALSFTSMAQGRGDRGGFPGNGGQRPNAEAMAKMQADQMKELVKLSDKQYEKVLDLFKKSSEQMQKSREGNAQRGGFDMEAMQKMQKEQDEQLKKILSDEQYKTWTESQKNRRGFGGPNGQGGPRQGNPRQGGQNQGRPQGAPQRGWQHK